MTTALFIYYTPSWQPLADIVLPIAARYCERWGYAPRFIKRVGPQDYVHGYYKLHGLRSLLYDYDLVWMLDLDTLITNPDIAFHKFCEDPNDQQLFFTEDVNGLNAGSWIARSTQEVMDWLEFLLQKFGDAPDEQVVINRYRNKMPTVKFLPHPSINSYLYTEYLNDWAAKVGDVPMPTHSEGNWQPGDFILHLPGLTLERRIDIFNMIKEQV